MLKKNNIFDLAFKANFIPESFILRN